jgi:hypothetical protein
MFSTSLVNAKFGLKDTSRNFGVGSIKLCLNRLFLSQLNIISHVFLQPALVNVVYCFDVIYNRILVVALNIKFSIRDEAAKPN